MEKQMNTVLQLPLQEIALRRVVVMLWNRTDVLSKIKPFEVDKDSEDNQVLLLLLEKGLQLVKHSLLALVLPEALLKRIADLITPIGLEIVNWQRFHAYFLKHPHVYKGHVDANLDEGVLSKLCWTSEGTVDYRKTAEELIRLEVLDDVLLYKLACLYCLEEYVLTLWEKLPEEIKKCFVDEGALYPVEQLRLHSFWAVILKDSELLYKHPELELVSFEVGTTFQQRAFVVAALTLNKAATEYFFQKLTREERNSLVFTTAKGLLARVMLVMFSCYKLPLGKHPDVLYFLFSRVSPEQQVELLQAHPFEILHHFLQWPWQDLFMNVAELTGDFFSVVDCLFLLRTFSDTVQLYGNISVDLFRKFIARRPGKFRSLVAEFPPPSMYNMFISKNTGIAWCTFENLDAATKATFMFSPHGFKTLELLMRRDDWPFVERLIRKAMLSKEDRARLEKNWQSRLHEGPSSDANLIGKFPKLLGILQSCDGADGCAASKRTLEGDVEPGASKKLCRKERELLFLYSRAIKM